MKHLPASCAVLVTIALGVHETTALAQQSVAPTPLFRGRVERDAPWLALLREANALGSQEKLVSVITEFLEDLAASDALRAELQKAKLPATCCDPRKHVYQVAFLASEAVDAPLIRIFVHRDGLRRGTLPGIEGPDNPLFEVFVAEDLSVRLDSVYQSEALENPLDKESGRFVETILSRLALPISVTAVAVRLEAATETQAQVMATERIEPGARYPPLAVTLSRVDLPSGRAKITINHTLSVADPVGHIATQAAWIADAAHRRAVVVVALGDQPPDNREAVAREVATLHEEHRSCSAIAASIADATKRVAGSDRCTPLRAKPEPCFEAIGREMDAAYLAGTKHENGCPAASAYPLMRRFVSTVPARAPQPVKGTTVVTNMPKTRWTFGLSTAYIAAIDTESDQPRARISGGRIVVDPFTRLLAMGTVSFVPWGYDPGSVEMSGPERLRLFGGIAFAPYFGGTAGAAWAVNRYLGVNAGYAHLFYDTPKRGEPLDAAPTEANRGAPFRVGRTHAFFIGLTYNLK